MARIAPVLAAAPSLRICRVVITSFLALVLVAALGGGSAPVRTGLDGYQKAAHIHYTHLAAGNFDAI